MKKVFQEVVDNNIGDCTRAVIASILEVDMDMVPHFNKWNSKFPGYWFTIFTSFMYGLGWKYISSEHIIDVTRKEPLVFPLDGSIDGYFYASVPSKTFENVSHAVVMNTNGVVSHDPNPNQLWSGENIIETGKAKQWFKFKRCDMDESYCRMMSN